MAYGHVAPSGRITVSANDDGLKVSMISRDRSIPIMSIAGNFSVVEECPEIHSVNYEMRLGKRKLCKNAFTTGRYVSETGDTVEVRLYNDGIAWKGSVPSVVDISAARNFWLQKWTDCYEEFFPKNPDIPVGSRWGYPALFEYENGIFSLLTESGITKESAGTSMIAVSDSGSFRLQPDGPGEMGWQTLIVGTLSDIVESTLVNDNSLPDCLIDSSWIEPGVASWVYWAYNHGSKDYEIVKKYIDMAAELSLPYVLIDAEWDEMSGEKTVEDAVSYAKVRGVKPLIWYNSSVGWINGAPGPKFRLNKPEDREKEFAWCEKIGVSGVKIDFFSGDTNLNLRYMAELLEAAADHHLTVNFHGATIPRGWQRTYPNLVSTEAVYGAEWYNNVPTFTEKAAGHNATLPFTRNVIGSMDYTPCAFSDSQHPHITTNAHELALTVLFESGIQHIADRPESILSQPKEVRDFFSSLPAAWDDTFLLEGYPGQYVLMARLKDNRLYIAAINGTDKLLTLNRPDISRLNINRSSPYLVFADGESPRSWNIMKRSDIPDSITLQPRGGIVFVVEPQN